MKNISVVNVELRRDYSLLGPECISNCEDAYKFICDQIGHSCIERFVLICIDYEYHPITYSLIGVGNSNRVSIDLGEIFKVALLANAKHIIIAHNHLGMSLIPTDSDLETTRKIGYIGTILNIPLIDSLIVNSNNEYLSIRKYIAKKESEKIGLEQNI